MSEKKRATGLLIMTEIPGMGLVAVLQRRGEFNHEKMGPESYPGGLQPTVWGGVKDEECVLDALIREIKQELGKRTWEIWIHGRSLKEIYRLEDEKGLMIAFGVKLPCDFLAEKDNSEEEVRLNASSGGLRLLKEEEIDKIQDLKNFDKTVGITDRNILAMFTDTKETIRRAFTLCRK